MKRHSHLIIGFFLLCPVLTSAAPSSDSLVVRSLLDSLKFKTVPVDSVASFIQLSDSPSVIIRLKLNNMNLRTVPRNLSKLTHLSELNLNNNLIDTIPGWVLKTNALYLSVDSNRISFLPDTPACNLYGLSVNHNQISRLPLNENSGYSAARYFYLAYNYITDIPDWFLNKNCNGCPTSMQCLDCYAATRGWLSIDHNCLCTLTADKTKWLNNYWPTCLETQNCTSRSAKVVEKATRVFNKKYKVLIFASKLPPNSRIFDITGKLVAKPVFNNSRLFILEENKN